MKYGSDKEVAAVTHNLKEEEYLSKTVQTLSLEESYSIKLLELDSQVVKKKYNTFKDRVSKIKSHLKANEIAELRLLESKGKLDAQYTSVNIGTSSKLAAAAKRLKLNNDRCKTEPPRKLKPSSEGVKFPGMKRAASITGIFIEAPSSRLSRRNSIDGMLSIPTADSGESLARGDPSVPALRAHTVAGLTHDREYNRQLHVQRQRAKIERAKTAHGFKTFNSYSSHTKKQKEASKQLKENANEVTRKVSFTSDDLCSSTFGTDPYKGRRRKLMESEKHGQLFHTVKMNGFFNRVDKAIEENPPFVPTDMMTPPEIIRDISRRTSVVGDSGQIAFNTKTRMKFPRGLEALSEMSHLSDSHKRDKLFEQWQGLKKCRYLRLGEGTEDLSGVTTLVVDQLKLKLKGS